MLTATAMVPLTGVGWEGGQGNSLATPMWIGAEVLCCNLRKIFL